MERQTRQRTAIWACLKQAERPLTTGELLDGAKNRISGLGIATVYRAVKDLVSAGQIVPVVIPGEPARYEVAGLKHHHHFYCKQCGKVYELDGCLLQEEFQTPEGFEVIDHEITLYGNCPRCRK